MNKRRAWAYKNSVNHSNNLILGIDIGGSGVKGAIVNLRKGDFETERIRIPTPNPKTLESLLDAVKQIVDAFEWKGVLGCTFPGVISSQIIETAANMGKEAFVGVNLAEEIGRVCACDAWVVNDADAAGSAEVRYGAGKGIDGVVLMLTVGTGIGSALFVNGKLHPNCEFGHLRMRDKKTGKNLSAEKLCADSIRKAQDMTWPVWAARFNKYLEYIHSLVWPDLIILGGGIASKSDKYLGLLDVGCDIAIASLENRAGIVGAACEAKRALL